MEKKIYIVDMGGDNYLVSATSSLAAQKKFLKHFNRGVSKKDWDNPFNDEEANIKKATIIK